MRVNAERHGRVAPGSRGRGIGPGGALLAAGLLAFAHALIPVAVDAGPQEAATAGAQETEQEQEATETPEPAPGQEPAATPRPEAAQASPTAADDGETDPMVELFVGKCASCHTIGDGDRVGPDLQGVHLERERSWLHSMIRTPSQMLASDPQARQLLTRYNGVKMPDLGLNDAQVEGLIDLIARCSDEPCDLAGHFVPVANATQEDVLRGERLFLGYRRLENGAGPCISCHTVRGAATSVPGGTLAMDLTNTYARLGDEGLDAALKNPAFALMNRIFADRPLSQEEAFALRAFLHDANLSEPVETASLSLPLFGLLGAGLVLLILNAFWGRRLRGVRKPLTQGGRAVQSRDLLAAGEGGSASSAAERGRK